jgi:hypothetical protein
VRKIQALSVLSGAALLVLSTTAIGWSATTSDRDSEGGNPSARGCGTASLHGIYGNSLSGTAVTPAGTIGLQFAANGLEVFDGEGHTHGTFTNQNSQLGSIGGTFSGTYTVLSDCTGSKDLLVTATEPTALAGSPPLHAHYEFVLVDGGRQLLYHGTTTGLNTVEQGHLVKL